MILFCLWLRDVDTKTNLWKFTALNSQCLSLFLLSFLLSFILIGTCLHLSVWLPACLSYIHTHTITSLCHRLTGLPLPRRVSSRCPPSHFDEIITSAALPPVQPTPPGAAYRRPNKQSSLRVTHHQAVHDAPVVLTLTLPFFSFIFSSPLLACLPSVGQPFT